MRSVAIWRNVRPVVCSACIRNGVLFSVVVGLRVLAVDRQSVTVGDIADVISSLSLRQTRTPSQTKCRMQLQGPARKYLEMIPLIAPRWSYDDLVETVAIKIWGAGRKDKTMME